MPRLPPGPWVPLALAPPVCLVHAALATPPDVLSMLLLAAVSALPCLLGALLGWWAGRRWRPGVGAQGAAALAGLLALLGTVLGQNTLGEMFLGNTGEPPAVALQLGLLALTALAPALACLALGLVLGSREPAG